MAELLALSQNVGEVLQLQGLVLVTAESCTGGGLASAITEVPGCSAWFDRGFVTYSNLSKVELLEVEPQLLYEQGAVSEAVVRAMVQGALNHSVADLAVAISGVAGPQGGTPEKPVGTVYIALADLKQTICRHYSYRWDRKRNKEVFSDRCHDFHRCHPRRFCVLAVQR